jgi:hypothetical protein
MLAYPDAMQEVIGRIQRKPAHPLEIRPIRMGNELLRFSHYGKIRLRYDQERVQ